MNRSFIINQLERNKDVFKALLENSSEELIHYKSDEKKWNLLEIICHLLDEEKEDFRHRLNCVLEDPNRVPNPIDPVGWVKSRKYAEQNFQEKLEQFLNEREESIKWLKSLNDVNWSNTFHHKHFGPFSADRYLTNWLAHDQLHIKQITRVKYDFIQSEFNQNIEYAGKWT